jgi:hypothetical protein
MAILIVCTSTSETVESITFAMEGKCTFKYLAVFEASRSNYIDCMCKSLSIIINRTFQENLIVNNYTDLHFFKNYCVSVFLIFL